MRGLAATGLTDLCRPLAPPLPDRGRPARALLHYTTSARLSAAERRTRAQTALKVVGLADRLDHFPRQLSGGQEQRVAIARAIVNDPKIIIADEPTGDLDRQSADDVLTLLQKLNQEFGKTIFMVTHDPAAGERAGIVRRLDKGVLQ